MLSVASITFTIPYARLGSLTTCLNVASMPRTTLLGGESVLRDIGLGAQYDGLVAGDGVGEEEGRKKQK